jgi:hypothetical protein
METIELTRAERRFRIWMLISAWMYATGGMEFLLGGDMILQTINSLSARVFPGLPLYPLPGTSTEGKFWLTLGLSMMAMITYICWAIYRDVRRNCRWATILLLSKFCSSVFYLGFFVADGHLAYLVGFLTDSPLFIITLALWVPATVGDRWIDDTEEDILAAIGEAMFPRGGAFPEGYVDFRKECIEDTRKMFAELYPTTRMGARMMLRALDLSPWFLLFSPATLRRLPIGKRQELLRRIEQHGFYGFRMIFLMVKIFVAMPFFNREKTLRAVGYLSREDV